MSEEITDLSKYRDKKTAVENEKIAAEVSDPTAWGLIKFVLDNYFSSFAQQRKLEKSLFGDKKKEVEGLQILGLIMKVRIEKKGDNEDVIDEIEEKEKGLDAVEKLGQMLEPPKSREDLVKEWKLALGKALRQWKEKQTPTSPKSDAKVIPFSK